MTGLQRILCGTLIATLLSAAAAFASNWTAPATDLAHSISSLTGPGTVTLTVTNSSSLTPYDVADIQKTVETQLRTAGVRIGSGASATSDVHVTLSENLQGYLWVAEITQGNETHVAMISLPHTDTAAPAKTGPTITLHKTLLWSQPAQILDAYVDNKHLVLLDSAALTTFSSSSGQSQADHTLALVHQHNFPRDLRGLLVPAKDHLADVYLPGTVCSITIESGSAISCRDGDDPWPLGTRSALFNSARNFFTGVLFPAGTRATAPFYSMAALDYSNLSFLVLTGIDGRVRVTDGVNEHLLAATSTGNWGSDVAAVKSHCGSGAQLLVTADSDDTATDSLRAFEFPGHEPQQVSAPLDFPGPITALWTHGDSVTAVARNLRTGGYEAYSVSIACNQ